MFLLVCSFLEKCSYERDDWRLMFCTGEVVTKTVSNQCMWCKQIPVGFCMFKFIARIPQSCFVLCFAGLDFFSLSLCLLLLTFKLLCLFYSIFCVF